MTEMCVSSPSLSSIFWLFLRYLVCLVERWLIDTNKGKVPGLFLKYFNKNGTIFAAVQYKIVFVQWWNKQNEKKLRISKRNLRNMFVIWNDMSVYFFNITNMIGDFVITSGCILFVSYGPIKFPLQSAEWKYCWPSFLRILNAFLVIHENIRNSLSVNLIIVVYAVGCTDLRDIWVYFISW